VGQRNAVTIGVTRFDGHEDLDFVPGLVKELGSALRELGYHVDDKAYPTLSSASLGAAVTTALGTGGEDDLRIVHLATHGHAADGNATVFALGSDGVADPNASIAHWLTMQQASQRPLTLFLLDLCSAGTSARLPWQAHIDGPTRGWVIAACRSDEAAYDGRFTQAMIDVLRALGRGELDLDPSLEYVSLATVARAVRQEVNRLADEAGAYSQQVTASLMDISDDDAAPFFRNPAYQKGGRPRLRAELDPAVLPFLDDLDEGLDARHFLERATGLGRLTDASTTLAGCFTGRDQELREVSPWLNGVGDAPLCVVTGSPGSGKSALLGVLVCAANSLLREPTRPIWRGIAQAPLPIAALAAVHARQRGLATIVASVSRQLGLPENLTAAELVTTLHKRTDRPVLVIDALDEADGQTEIMTELLLPLIAGESPVRVLVGVRHYPEYAPLFERAWVVDLDEVDQHVLEEDLHKYVNSLLRTTSYRSRGAVIGAFAQSVAEVLATGNSTWGPFLVAGLYTRHLVTANDPITDPAEAERLGQAVPSGLPDVLELDLQAQPDQRWLRPVLAALAHARGAGMPVSILTRTAPVFAPDLPAPTVAEIRSALTAGKFYLRQAMDSDRSNVYRLFHQGLADTLAQRPFALAGPYLDTLLSRLGPADHRDWAAAEPYLFRHVAEHAADADRLDDLENDPELFLNPSSPATMTAPFAGITSPFELALAAVRAGRPQLANRAANLPGRPPLAWQPRWTIVNPVREEIPAPTRPIGDYPLLAMSEDGSLVVTAHGSLVTFHTEESVHDKELAAAEITALATSDDGSHVIVGDVHGQLTMYNIATNHVTKIILDNRVSAARIGNAGNWMAVQSDGTATRSVNDGASYQAAGTRYRARHWSLVESDFGTLGCGIVDGKVIMFNVTKGTLVEGFPTPAVTLGGGTLAVSANGRYVVVTDGDSSFRYNRGEPKWEPLQRKPGVRSAAVGSAGETVLGFEDGAVWWFRSVDPAQVAHFSTLPIVAVSVNSACDVIAAMDIAGDVFTARRAGADWLLIPRNTRVPEEDPTITAVGRFTATHGVLGWSDGSVRPVKLSSGELGNSQSLFAKPVTDSRTVVIAGAETVLFSSEHHNVVIEPYSGAEIDVPPRLLQRTDELIVCQGRLAEVSFDDESVIIQYANGKNELEFGHPDCRVACCHYVGGRPFAFSGGGDGVVRVWDLEKLALAAEFVIGRPILQLVPDEMLLVRTDSEVLAFEYVS
jgi:hypothetical protein